MKTEFEYKDSVTGWLDKVPDGWTTTKILELYVQKKDYSNAKEELLSVYRDHGVIPTNSRDDNHNKPSEDLSNYILVQPGDLVINKMKAWQGSVAVSKYRGIVSPAYFTYGLTNAGKKKLFLPYFHHLLRSRMYVETFRRISNGVRPGQWDLDPYQFKILPVILPPIKTQEHIADFLDAKAKSIQELISQKEYLIELLKEKRAITITRAVTRGLNPNTKLKPSGVEWLGDIPEGWEIVPTKDLFVEKKSLIETSAADYSLLGLTTKGVRPRDPNNGFGKHPANYDTYQIVFPNDLLMCLFDYDVTPRTVGYVEEKGIVTGAYTRLVPKSGAVTKFYYYLFLFLDQKKELLHLCTGLRNTISGHIFWTLKNPKPSEAEQNKITNYLDVETAKIDKAITFIESEIEKLKEYRSSLIYSAVTGKIQI